MTSLRGIVLSFTREPISAGAGGVFVSLTIGEGDYTGIKGSFADTSKKRTATTKVPVARAVSRPVGFVTNEAIRKAIDAAALKNGTRLGTSSIILHPGEGIIHGRFTSEMLREVARDKRLVQSLMNSGLGEIVEHRIVEVAKARHPRLGTISFLPLFTPGYYRARLAERGIARLKRDVPLGDYLSAMRTFIRKTRRGSARPPRTSQSHVSRLQSPHFKPPVRKQRTRG